MPLATLANSASLVYTEEILATMFKVCDISQEKVIQHPGYPLLRFNDQEKLSFRPLFMLEST